MDILEKVLCWSHFAPEHAAHISDGHILSYRELDQNSDSLAAHLYALLPDDHSPVVVIGHKEPEMLVAFLAAGSDVPWLVPRGFPLEVFLLPGVEIHISTDIIFRGKL